MEDPYRTALAIPLSLGAVLLSVVSGVAIFRVFPAVELFSVGGSSVSANVRLPPRRFEMGPPFQTVPHV